MVSRVIPVDDFDLTVIGGTGDLARRKILPGLYRRFLAGQVPETVRIIGAARADMDDEGYRALVRDAIGEFVPAAKRDKAATEAFISMLRYIKLDALGDTGWAELRALVRPDVIRVFYLSVAPRLFAPLAERLHEHAIAGHNCRIVVEKPFGRDLASAKELNAVLARSFEEHQIYRIDHYLGKETVRT